MSPRDIITVIRDPDHVLGKRFDLGPDGVVTKTAAVSVAKGIAIMRHVPTHESLAALLLEVGEDPHAAIIPDVFKGIEVGEEFVILSERELEKRLKVKGRDKVIGVHVLDVDGKQRKVTGRLKENILPGSWKLLDRDNDKYTPARFAEMDFDQWRVEVEKLLPGAGDVHVLRAASTSARVFKGGKPVGAGNGHTWIQVADPDDVERCRVAITVRSVETGIFWKKQRLSRATGEPCGECFATVIDPSVFTPGRLVFVGRPVAGPGLTVGTQHVEVILGVVDDSLDTSRAVLPDKRKRLAAAS